MSKFRLPFFHLKKRLIVTYTAIFLLVMLTLMTGLYFYVRSSIQTLVDQSLSTQINLIRATIETTAEASIKNYFRSRAWSSLDVISDCYERFERGEITEVEAKRLALAYMASQKIGASGYITVTSADGKLIYHPYEKAGMDVSSYAFVQEGLKSEESFIKYTWKNPNETLPRDKSMYSIQFKPWNWFIFTTGYNSELRSLITVEDFEDNILAITFGETGYPVVIGLDGTLLIHPKYKGVNMMNRKDSMGDVTRKAITERNGKTFYYWKNPEETQYRKKITVYSEVKGFNMVVAATAYESEFMAPLYKLRWIFIGSVLLCLLVIIFLTTRISHTITRPIVAMKEWMEMAEKGDMNVRSTLDSEDEIGEIGRYFNNLMDNIQETQHRLIEEERYSSMGRLMAKVAHQLNTPIGNAITTVSFIEKDTEKLEEAMIDNSLNKSTLRGHIQTVIESTHILSRALSSASNLIEAFKSLLLKSSPTQPEDIDICGFLNEHYLGYWQTRLPEGIRLKLKCHAEIHINTYPELIALTLNNLTENSIIHGFKDGQDGEILVEVNTKEKGFEIIYEDNGAGISITEAHKLFEPFYGGKDNFSATGLGLYAVYNAVVQVFQGEIKYIGDEGLGVKYVIYIPQVNA